MGRGAGEPAAQAPLGKGREPAGSQDRVPSGGHGGGGFFWRGPRAHRAWALAPRKPGAGGSVHQQWVARDSINRARHEASVKPSRTGCGERPGSTGVREEAPLGCASFTAFYTPVTPEVKMLLPSSGSPSGKRRKPQGGARDLGLRRRMLPPPGSERVKPWDTQRVSRRVVVVSGPRPSPPDPGTG